jgi:esterase/lipase superfamily enzyme
MSLSRSHQIVTAENAGQARQDEPNVSSFDVSCTYRARLVFSLSASVLLLGCASTKPLGLMETPVLYHQAAVDPFAHLGPEDKTTLTQVFYATNRAPQDLKTGLPYGNGTSGLLHLGRATVRLGDENTRWEDLYLASVSPNRESLIPLTLQEATELAAIEPDKPGEHALVGDAQSVASAINKELEKTKDKELLIYVHGTKVDFANACALTAEIDHFTGRDLVGVGFAWPSHQNILSYVLGMDVRRATSSAGSLRRLIELLADHTRAEHINLIAYSAGGRVASKALHELRGAYGALDADALKKRFRLGAVIFAAADVPVDRFLERLPAISELSDQVVVTVSDGDDALEAAKSLMGGQSRMGTLEAEDEEEAFATSHDLENLEIIDVSRGQGERGFDIEGHHYWYRHPWASSDIVLLVRTELEPPHRGLEPAERPRVWFFAPHYPQSVQDAARQALKGQW